MTLVDAPESGVRLRQSPAREARPEKMATLPQLYRSTLRQFVANVRPVPPSPSSSHLPAHLLTPPPPQSIHPRAGRSPSIPTHLRALFESGRTIERGGEAAKRFETDVENLVVFLRARRIHKVRSSLCLPCLYRGLEHAR